MKTLGPDKRRTFVLSALDLRPMEEEWTGKVMVLVMPDGKKFRARPGTLYNQLKLLSDQLEGSSIEVHDTVTRVIEEGEC